MDKHTAVIADKMLVNKAVAGEDVTFELPEIALQTADIAAMGTLSLPLVGLLDDMTMTVKRVGIDKGYANTIKLEKLEIEFRWVQDVVAANGTVSHKGCKAFLNCIPQSIPSVSVEIGSASEMPNSYTVTRYQLMYDGAEILLVDRLNQILKVNGKDYMANIKKLL